MNRNSVGGKCHWHLLAAAAVMGAGGVSVLGLQACRTTAAGMDPGGSRVLEARAPLPGETIDRPVIDATTFGTGNPGWGRDGTEMETVKALFGLNTAQLIGLAEFQSANSQRTEYQRMAKPGYSEAFALGSNGSTRDDINKIPWGRGDHEVREANPYVSLTVESGRLTLDQNSGAWDLSVGTDYNVDVYYDTPDYILLANDATIRARNRMDQPGQIRRVLIQSKMALGVDDQGLKSAAKKDIRVDTTDMAVLDHMDTAAKSGKNVLRGDDLATADPIEAISSVYFTLKERNALPDLDGKSSVLLLNAQATIFSIRARYHLNFSSQEAMTTLFGMAPDIMAEARQAATGLPQAQQDEMARIADGLASVAILVDEVRSELETSLPGATIDAALVQRLLGIGDLTDKADLRHAHLVMQARDRLLKRFASLMSGLGNDWNARRRQLEASGSMGLALWFRRAARAFTGSGSSEWMNFLIDTFDYSRAMTFDDYHALSLDQKLMKEDIPNAKVFFASLVNEIQIELGLERPYVDCINKAVADPADEGLRKDAEMCRFLLSKLTAAQDYIGTRRGDEVGSSAQRAGLNLQDIRWASGEASKGENVLKIAREIPRTMP